MTPRPKNLISPTRRNVIIEDSLWRQVKERAKLEDRTISSLIRLVLKQYVERK